MEQESFPYKIWPGALFVAVLIGSGGMLKQISNQPEEPRRSAPQETDPQTTDSITIEGWAEKIRKQMSPQ